jgi:hypothetical protein
MTGGRGAIFEMFGVAFVNLVWSKLRNVLTIDMFQSGDKCVDAVTK